MLIASAVEMFPFAGEMRLMRQWAGIADMTSDYSPIMGLSPLRTITWMRVGRPGLQGDPYLRRHHGGAGGIGWQGA